MGLISRVSSRTYRNLWAVSSNQDASLSSPLVGMPVKRPSLSKKPTMDLAKGCTATLWSPVLTGTPGKSPNLWAKKDRQEEQDEAIHQSCQLFSSPRHQILSRHANQQRDREQGIFEGRHHQEKGSRSRKNSHGRQVQNRQEPMVFPKTPILS